MMPPFLLSGRNAERGQAFLALVFLIGSIIILVGVTLAILINSSIDTSYGYQSSLQAEAVATAGIEEGLLQLDRNPAFATTSYQIVVGSSTAFIAVTQNSPSTGKTTILASSTINNRRRKISAVVVQDSTTTGNLNVISWQDIP